MSVQLATSQLPGWGSEETVTPAAVPLISTTLIFLLALASLLSTHPQPAAISPGVPRT